MTQKWELTGNIIWTAGAHGGVICQMAEYETPSNLVEFKPISPKSKSRNIQLANARLICAAPDLYEALNAIIADYEHCAPDELGKIDKWRIDLIAKAQQALDKAIGG